MFAHFNSSCIPASLANPAWNSFSRRLTSHTLCTVFFSLMLEAVKIFLFCRLDLETLSLFHYHLEQNFALETGTKSIPFLLPLFRFKFTEIWKCRQSSPEIFFPAHDLRLNLAGVSGFLQTPTASIQK